jgi:demethylmenaquinone methyltransferase/2-methoxy-6-polyprenyl-1,4-benzoquinol methylase
VIGRIISQLKHKIPSKVLELYTKYYHEISNFLFYLPQGGEKAFRNKCLKFADLKAGNKILDLCCGTGKLDDAIGRQGLNVEVIGIDISKLAIEQAIKKVHHIPVSFLKANASCLPFRPSIFDRCFICFGLHHIPEHSRQKTLKEVYRVLAPEGVASIIEYNIPKRGIKKLAATTFINLDNRGEAIKMLKNGKLIRGIEEVGFEIVDRVLIYQGIVQLLKVVKV